MLIDSHPRWPPVICLLLVFSFASVLSGSEPIVRQPAPDKPKPQRRIPTTPCTAIAFSADGTLLATGEVAFHLYDVATGKKLSTGQRDGAVAGRCEYLSFSPDGRWLVSVHSSGMSYEPYLYVYLWQITPKKQLVRPTELLAKNHEPEDRPTDVFHAGFSPDSRTVVAGCPDGTIYLWECATRKERLRFQGGVAAAFTPDSKTLVVLSYDGAIRRHDAWTGRLVSKPGPRTDFIFTGHMAFSQNSELVAVSDGYEVLLQETTMGRRINRLTFPERCRGVAFSPDARTLAIAVGDGICIFDTSSSKELGWRKSPWNYGSEQLCFTPDGKEFAWASEKTLRIREYAGFLAGCGERPAWPLSDPPDVPLQAELVNRQDHYVLNLDGVGPEEFSRTIWSRVPPTVDLEFRLTNTGKKSITFPVDLRPSVFITGPGALNIRPRSFRLIANRELSETMTLAAGQTHAIPAHLSKLNGMSHWLLPGEYAIHASCTINVTPAPRGSEKLDDGSGSVTVRCPPIKVRVVEAKK